MSVVFRPSTRDTASQCNMHDPFAMDSEDIDNIHNAIQTRGNAVKYMPAVVYTCRDPCVQERVGTKTKHERPSSSFCTDKRILDLCGTVGGADDRDGGPAQDDESERPCVRFGLYGRGGHCSGTAMYL